MPQAAKSLGVNVRGVTSEVDALVRDLATKTDEKDQLPRLDFPFTPETVRARFEALVEAKVIRRREAQLQMAEAVSRGLIVERFMAIEAPTGPGTTFAYLIPSILWARSQGDAIAISTYTRLLQDQMADDLNKVRENLKTEFRAQVLKGMTNYACLERIVAVYAQTDVEQLDDEERFAWLYILCWLTETHEGLLDEINYWAINTFPALARTLEGLRSDRGECSRERCE